VVFVRTSRRASQAISKSANRELKRKGLPQPGISNVVVFCLASRAVRRRCAWAIDHAAICASGFWPKAGRRHTQFVLHPAILCQAAAAVPTRQTGRFWRRHSLASGLTYLPSSGQPAFFKSLVRQIDRYVRARVKTVSGVWDEHADRICKRSADASLGQFPIARLQSRYYRHTRILPIGGPGKRDDPIEQGPSAVCIDRDAAEIQRCVPVTSTGYNPARAGNLRQVQPKLRHKGRAGADRGGIID